MKPITRLLSALLAAVLLTITVTSCSGQKLTITPNRFTYQKVYELNPMKGFASFYTRPDAYSSLEYVGLKFSDIYTVEEGEGRIVTEYLDPILYEISERGHHAILRVYIINPDNNKDEHNGLFLDDAIYRALQESGDLYANSYEDHLLEYPDFNSPVLMQYMQDFIGKFGKQYDAHPAIAVIQLGLYGSWGEWNMSGCQNAKCTMTNENLAVLIEAYTAAFRTTKLMGRNPSLGHAYAYDIGFHDDNFLFNSSDFHKVSPEWKQLLKSIRSSYGTIQQFYDFMDGKNGAYEPIWDRWETQMFGGELSGLLYNEPFGTLWDGVEREAFDYCIRQFHMSWLMGMGQGGIPDSNSDAFQAYREVASSFGYELGITEVETKDRTGKVTVTLTNYGIAPFYYDWVPEYWLLDENGKVVHLYRDTELKLSSLLPGEIMQSQFLLPDKLPQGHYSLTLRISSEAESISGNVLPMKLANDHSVWDGVYELAALDIE